MKKPIIIITESDHRKLSRLIAGDTRPAREQEPLRVLEAELQKAKIVAPDKVPPDVITMDSRAELLDVESGEDMEFTVVFPEYADIEEGKISVLAPVGTGMLGYRVGDIFKSTTPFGTRQLKVLAVHFQPESALASGALKEAEEPKMESAEA